MPLSGLLVIFSLFFRASTAEVPKLLVVSFDGFPNRYLNKELAPNLFKLATEAAYFEHGATSQYIVHSWPNHMSISTGLYEESHGIIGNYFHNYATDEIFDNRLFFEDYALYLKSLEPKWYHGEPIWLANENAGSDRRTGAIFWPMAEAMVNGKEPHYVIPSREEDKNATTQLANAKENIDKFLAAFTRDDNPINLGLFYNSFLDRGDTYTNYKAYIREIDELIEYMLDSIYQEELEDDLNLIILSDRGISDVDGSNSTGRIVCDYINCDQILVNVDSIFPKNDTTNMNEVYAQLQAANLSDDNLLHIRVYWKDNLPKEYHYTHNELVGDIIVTGIYPSPFKLSTDDLSLIPKIPAFPPENKVQQSILIMRGPAFKKVGARDRDDVQVVDIFELMCHVLDIEPPANNGTLSKFKNIVKFSGSDSSTWWVTLLIVIAVIIGVGLLACCMYCIVQKMTHQYGYMDI